VKIWDALNGTCLRTLENRSWVLAVAISSDDHTIFSGGRDGTMEVWDFGSGKLLHTVHGHTGGVRGLCISPGGSRIVSGSEDKTIKIWNVCESPVNPSSAVV